MHKEVKQKEDRECKEKTDWISPLSNSTGNSTGNCTSSRLATMDREAKEKERKRKREREG